MSKPAELAAIAASQVGVRENPSGSNNVIYNTDYYGRTINSSSYAWCAVFVWWCMKKIGCADLYYGGNKTAYVPALLDWARKAGRIVTDPQVGDWIVFDWNSNDVPDHIGIIENVSSDRLTTVEGNVNDAVVRRTWSRSDKQIMTIIRPAWPAEPEPEFVTKTQLAAALRQLADRLMED
jgi:hypothetical protein